MSCTSKTKPYIKFGDSFDVPVQLVDENGLGVEILPEMVFSTKIINLSEEVIATPSITPYPDQVLDKGFMLLSVPTSVTSTWTVGKATLDIKLVVGGSVKHSQDYSFEIRRAIT